MIKKSITATLENFYKNCSDIEIENLNVKKNMEYLKGKISSNKGVFTVIVTLALYKFLYPKQDIRLHKIEFKNGFSGRSFDTKYVTPTLKKLGLISMAESGWLTRSLEQPYPYNKDYKGKITPKELLSAFLEIVDYIQISKYNAKNILFKILFFAKKYKTDNEVELKSLLKKDIQIQKTVDILKNHFEFKYETHGGSKLPVLAFYSYYTLLVQQLKKYNDCYIPTLNSHTASDKSSKSAGDIQIIKNNQIIEAIEVKLNKQIDTHLINLVYDKIRKFNINRYYIFTAFYMSEDLKNDLFIKTNLIYEKHGCQIIFDNIYETLLRDLRNLESIDDFFTNYLNLVEIDKEIQLVHKEKIKEFLLSKQ
jgi:DNA (cytosine-5)-methyltransferase 1